MSDLTQDESADMARTIFGPYDLENHRGYSCSYLDGWGAAMRSNTWVPAWSFTFLPLLLNTVTGGGVTSCQLKDRPSYPTAP
ncbi:MAG: hypothetical protein ABR501_02660 [Pyrinomonadaceae bacterium]